MSVYLLDIGIIRFKKKKKLIKKLLENCLLLGSFGGGRSLTNSSISSKISVYLFLGKLFHLFWEIRNYALHLDIQKATAYLWEEEIG